MCHFDSESEPSIDKGSHLGYSVNELNSGLSPCSIYTSHSGFHKLLVGEKNFLMFLSSFCVTPRVLFYIIFDGETTLAMCLMATRHKQDVCRTCHK